MIRRNGKHYAEFSGYNTLVRGVFHDLGLEPQLKIDNLPYKSLGTLFKRRLSALHHRHRTGDGSRSTWPGGKRQGSHGS